MAEGKHMMYMNILTIIPITLAPLMVTMQRDSLPVPSSMSQWRNLICR